MQRSAKAVQVGGTCVSVTAINNSIPSYVDGRSLLQSLLAFYKDLSSRTRMDVFFLVPLSSHQLYILCAFLEIYSGGHWVFSADRLLCRIFMACSESASYACCCRSIFTPLSPIYSTLTVLSDRIIATSSWWCSRCFSPPLPVT